MEQPVLGKNFNLTNCVTYIESTLRRVIKNMKKQNASPKHGIDDLRAVQCGIAHADYCQKTLPDLVDLSKELNLLVDSLRERISNNGDKYESRSWADVTEFAELCEEITDKKDASPLIHRHQDNKDVHRPFADGMLSRIPRGLSIQTTEEYWVGNSKFVVPHVEFLEEIPPALYHFSGDDTHPNGMYICIAPQVYVQVPFTRVFHESVEKHRMETCTHGSDCINHHCSFAHPGAPFFRIGHSVKCPGLPTYGNIDTLSTDVQQVTRSDIRKMMLYSLADLASAYYWFQENRNAPQEHVMKDIDICED